jgi:hypothetical protein
MRGSPESDSVAVFLLAVIVREGEGGRSSQHRRFESHDRCGVLNARLRGHDDEI